MDDTDKTEDLTFSEPAKNKSSEHLMRKGAEHNDLSNAIIVRGRAHLS